MSGEIYMAAAGALATERRLELLANNLANVNTAGFKRDIGHFKFVEPESAQSQEVPPDPLNSEIPVEGFWMEFRSVTDFSGGHLKRTGNALDVALNGEGFFSIQTPEGVRYTRSGDFTIAADGVLSTRDGFAVMGEGGEIKLPITSGEAAAGDVAVDSSGDITFGGRRVGRLQIVDFEDRSRLIKVGNTRFEAPEDLAAADTGNYSVTQGFLEMSNVDAVRMMTEMIEVLRGYEAYQKVIQSVDKINSAAVQEVSR